MHPKTWPIVAVLLFVALVSAVTVPPATAGFLRSGLQGLLVPVVVPLRLTAQWARAGSPAVSDVEAVRRENDALRGEVGRLQAQLRQAITLERERTRIGRGLAARSTPVKVLATEAGTDDLMLVNAPGNGVRAGQVAFYGVDLVGRVREVSPTGARVRTITDPASVLNVRFGYFAPPPTAPPTDAGAPRFVERPLAPVAVRGSGSGLVIEQLKTPRGEVPVAVGDIAFLDDPRDWPAELTGVRVGVVEEITARPDAAQVVEVRLSPTADLRGLLEVLVLTGDDVAEVR